MNNITIEYDEGILEDHYLHPQILVKNLLNDVDKFQIVEIWLVKRITGSLTHHIILFNDHSFLCTCLMIINFGIPCWHFFSVMKYTNKAQFSVRMINSHWYNEDQFNEPNQNLNYITIHQTANESIINNVELQQIKELSIIEQLHGGETFTEPLRTLANQKQQYTKGMGLCKKAVDIALKSNTYNELCGMLNNFINTKISQQISNVSQNLDEDLIPNPVVFARRGRPPNRYKSSLEIAQLRSRCKPLSDISNKSMEDNRGNHDGTEASDIHKSRRCKNCKEYGHYSKTCPVNK